MPTKDECQELIDNTKHSWTTVNSVNGRNFPSTVNTSVCLFLSAAGTYDGGYWRGAGEHFVSWTSSWDAARGYAIRFYLSSRYATPEGQQYRYQSYSIRGILSLP